jgi:hypothetical protein
MANGYCPALLRHIEDVAGGNSPGRKMHISGFTKMLFCCQNSSVSPINDGLQSNSHRRTLTVVYRERPTLDVVQDEDTCDVNRIPVKKEWTLPNLLHKQTSFFIPDDEIKQYCDEFSQSVAVGQPATTMMREHYNLFVESANILLKAINQELVTEMAAQFGNNTTTGGAGGKVININRAGQQMQLNDGIIALLSDLRDNELCDEPCIVGGGNFSAYDIARMASCCSSAGVDAGRLGLPPFWFDKDTQDIWGANTIGVFAKGSVKFISYNKYLGAFGGVKGNSIFFTAPFPVDEFAGCADMLQCLRDLRLDVQMRYIDCPTQITVNGAGDPVTVNRGWQVILSKDFQLWAQPLNAYAAGDELESTNGTLLYYVDNDCVDCDEAGGAYGYGA